MSDAREQLQFQKVASAGTQTIQEPVFVTQEPVRIGSDQGTQRRVRRIKLPVPQAVSIQTSPSKVIQTAVQTSPLNHDEQKGRDVAVQVQAEPQPDKIKPKKVKVTSTGSQAAPESTQRGSYELQKHVAMLNKLCVFHLNRATSRGQNRDQTRNQLEQNRELFEQCLKILNYLKKEFNEQAMYPAAPADHTYVKTKEISSRQMQPLDEDMMLQRIKPHSEAILVPNVALFKFFKLPRKLEGNLLLIMYLLNNTLDTIFEKLWQEPQLEDKVIQLPHITNSSGQRYGNMSDEQGWYRQCQLETSFEAPEPQVDFGPLILQAEVVQMGLADTAPVAVEKRNNRAGKRQPKADMYHFDREKFYNRLGIKSDPQAIDIIEECEVCTTELGSEGLADDEEITLEKHVNIEAKKARKADLSSFDYDAFLRRQGHYDSPSARMVVVERQMTTEEFEPELADQIPVELSKQVDISKKQLGPDMNKRASVQLQSSSPAKKSDEALTERKTYMLPTLEAMTSTWTRLAIRLEECSPEVVVLSDNEEDYDEEDEEDEEEENVTTDGEHREENINKEVQKSSLNTKLRLNDYVFDERQNLQEDLMQIELKKVIKTNDAVDDIAKLMKKGQAQMEPDPEEMEPQDAFSPNLIVRHHRAQFDDEHHLVASQNQYLDRDQFMKLNDAVNFVSPVSHLNAHKGKNTRGTRIMNQRYGSPQAGKPPSDGSVPYEPHRSSRGRHSARRGGFNSSPHGQAIYHHPHQSLNLANQKYQGNKTPQAIQNRIRFPYQDQESAPTTKLNQDAGNLSERLEYNKDPLSLNRGQLTIDDEGNINMARSLSPAGQSPVDEEFEIADEAKTFVSSHFMFSHLMSFDAKKNTLGQLNNAKNAILVRKGIQHQARDTQAYIDQTSQSHYLSPSQSRRSGRAGSRASNWIGGAASMNSLPKLLSGRSPLKARSFHSGSGMNEPYAAQQPLVVKHATYIQNRHQVVSPIRQVKVSPIDTSSSRDRASGSNVKQHTFYPNQLNLHQIIPEQQNEETSRRQQTGYFEIQQEQQVQAKSPDNQAFNNKYTAFQLPEESSYGTEEAKYEQKGAQKSFVSQGNFSQYLVNSGGQVQTNSRKDDNNDNNDNNDNSVIENENNANNRSTLEELNGLHGQFQSFSTNQKTGLLSVSQLGNEESKVHTHMSRQKMNLHNNQLVNSQSSGPEYIIQNQRERQNSPYYPYDPSCLNKKSGASMSSVSQILNQNYNVRGNNSLSRQTLGSRSSYFGGNDSTISMQFKKKLVEIKGPQTSDIMPAFRMIKARPIEQDSSRREKQSITQFSPPNSNKIPEENFKAETDSSNLKDYLFSNGSQEQNQIISPVSAEPKPKAKQIMIIEDF